ncbi:hypothetical protein EJ08DRAFT_681527 [Tothia fuscella]|uniref:Trichothecene 3-O-acetyltransferase-like N-terminal domain-containing protein n=1 Tax=Tothia fuscella TaxID=1048955 RepID=A0A9P4NKW3_9PEZI|nr:hypothetical protein EJ08DRAFT_681527 [Tothia fuscella]
MSSEGEYFFTGPDFDFGFAVNDAFIFNLYSYRILVFKIDSPSGHETTANILKIGLQKLVERCPPLGGVIVNIPGEQRGWKKARPGPGIKLVVRDLRSKLNYEDLEAKNFPVEAFKCEEVVPISPAPIMEGEASGSVFQYTWIDGGALLTVGIDHPITDGNGMNTLMGVLADECRLAGLVTSSTEIDGGHDNKALLGVDRSIVRALSSKSKNKPEDHPSYTFLTAPPSIEESHPLESKESLFMFQISPSKLGELKKAANTLDSRVSTHDANGALTWRSVMLARHKAGVVTDLDTEIEYHCPTDARRFVGLDKDYVGNMIYLVRCNLRLRDLLEPDNLPKVAASIRSALEARSRELIEGFHSLCKSLPDLSQVSFGWIEKISTTAFAMGSSWRAEQMYGADWGSEFGPVMRFRSPDVGFFGILKGMTFICPRVQGTGPAEFQTWLEPEGWKALQEDELFTRFCSKI